MLLNTLKVFSDLADGWECSFTPRPDQVEALEQILSQQRSADYSEVGTGKSLVSYLYILRQLSQARQVMVVMPPALIPQYMRNFGCITYLGNPLRITRLHEDRKQRELDMDYWDKEGWPDCLIMSYQLYIKYAPTWRRLSQYRVLVADEAHNVSRHTTKGFQQMFQHVMSKDLDLLLMTATPCTTELETAYGQIRLRFPKAYASVREFEHRHCVYAQQELPGGKMVPQIVGYKDIEGINQHLMNGAVRRRAKDVLDLQSLTIIDHLVQLHPLHAELYRRLLEEWMLELGDEVLVARNKQALRQWALQLITNPAAFQEVDTPQAPDEPLSNLMAIIDSIDLKQTKLIIFCNFKATVRKLEGALSQWNPALIYGDSNVPKEIEKLLGDDSCRIGILNFQSGGAGFNLQDVAHHIVVYEALGSPGLLQQAIGRCYRGGQEHPVIVWIFRYHKTMSTLLFNKNFGRARDIQQSLSDQECFVDFITDNVKDNSIQGLRNELGLT